MVKNMHTLNMIDPEIGFTSEVIKDPKRFVGRTKLIESCISAINSSHGVIAIYGKRGVGDKKLSGMLQKSLVLQKT